MLGIDALNVMTETLQSMLRGLIERTPQIVIALVILVIAFFVARFFRWLIKRLMKSASARPALIRLFVNLSGIAVWIVAIAFATVTVFPSITPANFVASLGLTSVAIGFAFKDVFENFLAGIIILYRKEMRIGDVIDADGVSGRIEDITIRETHVRTLDGELVLVPNAHLFKEPLTIITDKKERRNRLSVGVDYDASLKDVRSALRDAIDQCTSIKDKDRVEIVCTAFGGSSIDFDILWWASSEPQEQRASYDELAFAVKSALDEVNISIPFPQTTLSFRDDAQPVGIQTKPAGANDDEHRQGGTA